MEKKKNYINNLTNLINRSSICRLIEYFTSIAQLMSDKIALTNCSFSRNMRNVEPVQSA